MSQTNSEWDKFVGLDGFWCYRWAYRFEHIRRAMHEMWEVVRITEDKWDEHFIERQFEVIKYEP